MAQSHTPRSSCVRFVFGLAIASRNARLQAARYALPGLDFHQLIAPALAGAFSFYHLGERAHQTWTSSYLPGVHLIDAVALRRIVRIVSHECESSLLKLLSRGPCIGEENPV